MIYDNQGNVSCAPDFKDENEPTKRCDVCEYEHFEYLTVTLKDCGTTICAGCAKMLDIKDVYFDCTTEELKEIMNQLKPIL